MPSRLNPCLSSRDDAREAMEFYQGVFSGELTMIMHGMLEAEQG